MQFEMIELLIVCGFSILVTAVLTVIILRLKYQSQLKQADYKFNLQRSDYQRVKEQAQDQENQLIEFHSQSLALESANTSLKEKKLEIAKVEERLGSKESLLQQQQQQLTAFERKAAESETRMEEQGRLLLKEREILGETKIQLQAEFENLANKIFEEKSQKISSSNKEQMDVTLRPLQQQLNDFKQQVESVYDKESKDRIALFHEISHLKKLNEKITSETSNLTSALKGDNKAQGNWGEMVLESILESSGLKNGREYDTQSSYKTEEGRTQRPDVIVHLPEQKDIIIDSKVSLIDYERYCSCDQPDEREQALKAHLQSIKKHIKDLSDKDYSALYEIKSLDYVLLFMPIESAFLTAMEHDSELFNFAFEKNIVLVSPSTLLVTLKTIQNIWRYEYQNQNAQEIARQAGGLYDQIVRSIESFVDVGEKIDKAQQSFEEGMTRMGTGRGNVIKRIEKLKALGAKAKKELPVSLQLEHED